MSSSSSSSSSASASAAASSPVSRKRKSLSSEMEAGASSSLGAGATATTNAAGSEIGIELDEKSANMTVEEYLQHYLATMTERAKEVTEVAIDSIELVHKHNREELRNLLHTRKAEQAAKNKAGKKKVWDVHLTVVKCPEDHSELVGREFVVHPRQRPGGMAKIGRSTGDDFREGSGVSLAHDWSVSTWHGKFTSVYGTVYYTDLSTNGTRYNGDLLVRDTPTALQAGDELELGGTTLRVKLVQATEASAAGGDGIADEGAGR